MEEQKSTLEKIIDAYKPLQIGNVKERRKVYHRRSFKISCQNLLDDFRATLGLEKDDIGVEYHPLGLDTISNYEKVGVIYELPLSPSVITLTSCKDTGEVSVLHLFLFLMSISISYTCVTFFINISTSYINHKNEPISIELTTKSD